MMEESKPISSDTGVTWYLVVFGILWLFVW
jgi:hypothetical protein